MGYEPLHHKYRPQTFTQLVGQDAIATTLSHALEQQRIAPAYLFCGPRGTGKTSSARILAKSLNCLSHSVPDPQPCGHCDVCRGINDGSILDIVEIDAASNTGVDNIRELIERAQFAPVQCRYKVYVIDECHMLSTAAFNALLKTLEEPPAHVIFVLATTDPQRVLPTIISRCQRFDFRRIPLDAMVEHLQVIAQQEAIDIQETAVRLVAQVAQGGLRDAESLLDQLSLLAPPVTAEKVWDLVGAVPERDLLALVQAIATDDGVAVLDTARRLMDRGREPLIVLQNLAGFYRDLIIAKTAGARADLVAVTPPTWEAMQAFVQSLPLPLLLAGQQTLRQAETQIRNTTQPRLWLEVTLMGLLPSALGSSSAIAPNPTPSHPLPPTALPKQPPPARAQHVEKAPHSSPQDTTPKTAPLAQPPPASPTNTPSPPTPSPAAAAPPDAATSPPDNSHPPHPQSPAPAADLPKIWAQVIRQLHPMGSRVLMQQQGELLSWDGQVVRIGIKSKPLLKMAKERVSHVETAFQKVLGQSVTIALEVIAKPASKETPASHQPSNAPPPAPHIAPPEHAEPSPSPPIKPEPFTPNQPTPSPAASSPTPAASSPTPPPAWTPSSDFDRAVKSFAEFFNGQIVSLDDEEEEPSKNGKKSKGKKGKGSPKDKKATGGDATVKPPPSPDSDVPF
ncbi:MAG: DNA polymerase III subunit gamma/tau [Cyanobacteria bacterium J06639_14]